MQFITWQFIIFFIIAMLLLLSRSKQKRNILLLLNIIFYLYSGIAGFLNLLVFTVITFVGGKSIEKNNSKVLFIFVLILSLLPLVLYKYTDFIIRDCLHISEGVHNNISIPLGISFVTFQGVGYIIDIFKGKYKAEKNIIDYFIYLSLFTSVISGPINRPENILMQIKKI